MTKKKQKAPVAVVKKLAERIVQLKCEGLKCNGGRSLLAIETELYKFHAHTKTPQEARSLAAGQTTQQMPETPHKVLENLTEATCQICGNTRRWGGG